NVFVILSAAKDLVYYGARFFAALRMTVTFAQYDHESGITMQSIVFKLPDLGEGVVEAEIVAWHVKPGEDVRVDQPLVDVMTDKATVTIPSGLVGRIVRTHGDVGQTVAVGAQLVSIDTLDVEAGKQTPIDQGSSCLPL